MIRYDIKTKSTPVSCMSELCPSYILRSLYLSSLVFYSVISQKRSCHSSYIVIAINHDQSECPVTKVLSCL